MADNVQAVRVGAATVTIVDVYTIPTKLNEVIAIPEDDRTPENLILLHRTELLPVQCILIQLSGNTVLVDAGAYDKTEDHSGRIKYIPPTGLLARLAEAGVEPDDVQHVVVTHTHGDHYNATTFEQNGRFVPTFPNAQIYFGKADLARTAIRDALRDPASLDSRTIGVLARAGRIVAVESDREIASGITIVASPGETPGHQSVRISSEGETLYCVGDLYHHPVEVDHPTWAVASADPETIVASRAALATAALAANAMVIATHIKGVGRLTETANGVTWETF